jgi:hypothetical protein
MSDVRKSQGWKFFQLEKKFKGISHSTWKSYFQSGYKKMRPIHAVAAYSWLTMLPVDYFYNRSKIHGNYGSLDDLIEKCLLKFIILPRSQFEFSILTIYSYLTEEQKTHISLSDKDFNTYCGILGRYNNADWMFPTKLDMDKFSSDYYSSLSFWLVEFRENNNISIDFMAEIAGLSLYRYNQCENPNKSVPISVNLIPRLMSEFNFDDTIPFSRKMRLFPQFHTARKIQKIREELLMKLLSAIDYLDKNAIFNFVSSLSSIYVQNN